MMDPREEVERDSEITRIELDINELDIILQNAEYLEIFGALEVPAVILAPAAQNAHVEDAAASAGGDPVSSQLSITTQEALDLDIILAYPQLPLVDEEEEDYTADEEDEDYTADEEDEDYTADEEDEDEDRVEDNVWVSNLLNKDSKSTVPQLQPPIGNSTIIQVNRAEICREREPGQDREEDIILQAMTLLERIQEQEDAIDDDDLNLGEVNPEIMEEFLQIQMEVDLEQLRVDDSYPQQLAGVQDQVAHEVDPLNQALVLGEDPLVGPEGGALDSPNLSAYMSPALNGTTLQQDKVVQPRAIDVSLETPSITSLESPGHDALISPGSSETDIMVEADDASSRLQLDVGRAPGSGPHVVNPALEIQTNFLATLVRSEDAATANNSEVIITTTRLVASMDPVQDQDQDGSITSTALHKEHVTSSESSSSFTASSSSI